MNKRSLERLTNTLNNLEDLLKGKPVADADTQGIEALQQVVEQSRTKFENAMDDDFNTALAIAVLFDISKEINSFVAKNAESINEEGYRALAGAKEAMEALGNVLGIFIGAADDGASEELVDGLMQLIIEIRAEARAKKDWPTADKIRDTLNQLEILIEDTAQGTRWKRK